MFLLVGLAALGGAGGTPPATGRKPNSPVEVPAGEEQLKEFAATICECVAELGNAGAELTAQNVLACVLDRWYPTTVFPPIAEDPQSVKDAFAMAAAWVTDWRNDPAAFAAQYCGPDIIGPGGIAPAPPPQPPEPPQPAEPTDPGQGPLIPGVSLLPVDFGVGPIPPVANYPWEAPLIHQGTDGTQWPTPGMFFLVRAPNVPTDPILALDSILGIARVALAAAYAMAGAPRLVGEVPDSAVLQYVDLIACSPWNDKAYGTSSSVATGGEYGLGPHGRGVNMYPRHHDNIAALSAGQSPKRSTYLAGQGDNQVEGTNNKWPQLWLPPIRLDLLASQDQVTTQGLAWSNGDSVLVPPPMVWAHGVYARVSPPNNQGWGC
jgi:hypothetical protein